MDDLDKIIIPFEVDETLGASEYYQKEGVFYISKEMNKHFLSKFTKEEIEKGFASKYFTSNSGKPLKVDFTL